MEYILKIVLLGDTGVGKTSLVYRFIENRFSTDFKSTLGVNLLKRTVEVEGNQVTVQIWDLGGQEAYKRLRKLYLDGASGALLVYDVTNTASFDHLTEWFNSFIETRSGRPAVLIGNKVDLKENKKVSTEQGKTFSNEKQCVEFIEASAKTGENVEAAFKNLIKSSLQLPEKK
jgi:small GTP-binding protein